ncbi:MAG TPA: hypothetical protein VHD59_17175 [Pseudolabrys sp.]|jgi:hypothetical protein|nr:hypothetical protein [Pseudolabrys sp.]
MDESDETRLLLLKSVLDLETRGLNYLLVANGAGLAACLATLKDYATTPQLKGIGLVIGAFSGGLMAAGMAFVLFQIGSFEMMRHVTIGNEPQRGKWPMMAMNTLLSFSGTCFLFAILTIATKMRLL